MSEDQAQYTDRRADSQALLAEFRHLRERMSDWTDKLQAMEVNHEARLRVLERENLRISGVLDAIMTRLNNLDITLATIPTAIKQVIQEHELAEKADKIEILKEHLRGVRNIVGGAVAKVLVGLILAYLVYKFPEYAGLLKGLL